MTTNEKLKEILIRLLIENVTEEAVMQPEIFGTLSTCNNRLEKIARTLVYKAESGDIKALDKIREIIGDVNLQYIYSI